MLRTRSMVDRTAKMEMLGDCAYATRSGSGVMSMKTPRLANSVVTGQVATSPLWAPSGSVAQKCCSSQDPLTKQQTESTTNGKVSDGRRQDTGDDGTHASNPPNREAGRAHVFWPSEQVRALCTECRLKE